MEFRGVLDQVNVVVRDMEAMATFYRRLGMTLGTGSPEWAPHHLDGEAEEGAALDLDSEAFATVWNRGWPGGSGVVLGFRLPTRDAVDRLYDELTTAGHAGQQAPYDAFWGARYAVVSDPDGNAVGLMSPADEEYRSPPPSVPGPPDAPRTEP